MKLTKIIAGIAASAVAASTMVVAASATLQKAPAPEAGLSSGTGAWLVQLYNKGNEEEGKPATDYGIDYSKVAGIAVTVTIPELDSDGKDNRIFWDGTIGGSVTFSVNGEDIEEGTDLWDTYNWPNYEYWGVYDEALELSTNPNFDEDATNDKPGSFEKVDDYTYRIVNDSLVNPLANGDARQIGCMQVGLQEWSTSLAQILVTSCEVLDADGNVLISFDQNGVATVGGTSNEPTTEEPTTEEPTTEEPTTGDSTKPSTNTGVESVALVAGVAVLATGAVIVAKKRK